MTNYHNEPQRTTTRPQLTTTDYNKPQRSTTWPQRTTTRPQLTITDHNWLQQTTSSTTEHNVATLYIHA